MFVILVAGLIVGTAAGLVAAFSPFLLAVPRGVRPPDWLVTAVWPADPFMIPVFLYALLNSTFVTLRRGGICWRETFYPLETLRAGNVK